MKYLYKYPQREFPYGRLIEENQRRAGPRAGVRAARHRHLRRRPLLRRRSSSTRRRRPRTSSSASTRRQSRPRGRRRSTSAAPLVSQHLGLGPSRRSRHRSSPRAERARLRLHPRRRPRPASPCATCPSSTSWAARHLYVEGGGRLLFTDNETNAARVFGPGARSRTPYVKDAFHRHVITGEACVNPDEVGTKACWHYAGWSCPPGGSACCAAALEPASRSSDPLRRRRPGAEPAPGRGRRVLRGDPATPSQRRRAARPAPGLRRHALVQADLPLRRQPLARGRQPALAAARRVTPADPQRPLAAPQLDAHPVDAGQVGVPVVRRLGPRLPLRRRSPPRPGLREGAALAAALRAVPASRRARSPPTSGSSRTSTRRCTPGPSGASTTWTASARARPTAPSSRSASTSC